mgnify:CR=1 FL=1
MNRKTAIMQLRELNKLGSKMRLAAEDWDQEWKILISTIMSARTRDEKTISIALKLFQRYKTLEKLANAKLNNVKKIIKQINFYKTKSKNIINCAKLLIKNYHGKIPDNIYELIKLLGVGRKTANVFLSENGKFGLAVDTHVFFVSKRLGWAESNHPHKVEEELKRLFPQKYWNKVNSTLVRFGKTYTSRKKKDEILSTIKNIK